ncbi:MAG: hypothetical protein LBU99_05250, partial [Spirochaetaceae bacterium]|nr:hypothetical protein [Spirochaetaceae bacterium]
MKKVLCVLVVIAGMCVGVFSEEIESPLLKLDFPLFDLPYQIEAGDAMGYGFFGSYTSPSMAQSLAIATDVFSAFHYGMGKFYDSSRMHPVFKNILFYGGTILGDILL